MHGRGGGHAWPGGHVWQGDVRVAGVCVWSGACVAGDVCDGEGGRGHARQETRQLQQALRVLLKYILVIKKNLFWRSDKYSVADPGGDEVAMVPPPAL